MKHFRDDVRISQNPIQFYIVNISLSEIEKKNKLRSDNLIMEQLRDELLFNAIVVHLIHSRLDLSCRRLHTSIHARAKQINSLNSELIRMFRTPGDYIGLLLLSLSLLPLLLLLPNRQGVTACVGA